MSLFLTRRANINLWLHQRVCADIISFMLWLMSCVAFFLTRFSRLQSFHSLEADKHDGLLCLASLPSFSVAVWSHCRHISFPMQPVNRVVTTLIMCYCSTCSSKDSTVPGTCTPSHVHFLVCNMYEEQKVKSCRETERGANLRHSASASGTNLISSSCSALSRGNACLLVCERLCVSFFLSCRGFIFRAV